METKLISVVIPVYNQEKYIERCLRSVLNQNIEKDTYEIIVVNDGSTDNSLKILNKYSNVINLINSEYNKGLPAALNKAIQSCKSKYVVRVDSDDYVNRKFVYLCRLFLNLNREYQAVAVDYNLVDNNEVFIEKKSSMKNQIACGIMFRKECLFDIGLYNPKFKMREGHEIRIRFEKKHKIGHLNLPLYKYRMHEKNRTKKISSLKKYDRKLIT